MKKKILVSIVILLVVSLLILSPLALDALGEIPYATSDSETYADGVFYYIDSNGGGYVFSDVPGTDERTWYTDYSADGICIADEKMYVSEGNRIHCIDMDTLRDEVLVESDSEVVRFAYTGGNIYYLSSGELFVRKALTGTVKKFLSGGITGFWLDGANELSYTDDNIYIHTVNLMTGRTEDSVNLWSDLGDNIQVKTSSSGYSGTASEQDENIISLQSKFPDGQYWNHTGSGTNNPNGYTSRPCTHHGVNGSGCNYSGSCGCNSFASAIQCMGYAFKCGYDVTGYSPNSGNGGWNVSTNKSEIDYVKAGDVIRYRNDGHSIYVTGVFGDTITYTDCNSDSHCVIKWNKTVTKNTVKSTFTKIYISPFDAGIYQIQFDANGGTCKTAAKTVEQGMTYGELPVATREGYVFEGWFTDPEDGTIVTPDTIVDLRTTYKLYAHWTLIVYKIAYVGNGENVSNIPSNQQKDYNETIELNNPTPERVGYTFDEWNTAPDGSGTRFGYGVRYANNSNLTLYAVWKANDYYVTLKKNGGTCSGTNLHVLYDHPYAQDASSDITGSLPIPEKKGYDFLGWYTQEVGGTRVTDDTIVRTASNHALYARYDVAQYTVMFDANGGAGAPATITFLYDSSAVIPSVIPTREGYDFLRWSTKSDGSGISYYAGSEYKANASLKLFAIWKIRPYDISYDANGGYGAPTMQTAEYGTALNISNTVPRKTGYEFISWNTSQDGTGKNYMPGDEYTENTSIKLYANWKVGEYKVTYLALGGLCSKKTDVFPYGTIYSELPTPTKEGYTFGGWYTNRTGGTEIKAGDKVNITEDTYLYAHWNPVKYSVAYYGNGGENLPANQFKEHDVPLVLSYKIPNRTGYSFVEWNTEKDGTGISYRSGETYFDNMTVVLYAQWKVAVYSITYSTVEGTGLPASQTKEHGTSLILSAAKPERDGYTFAGWNTSYDGTGDTYAAGGIYSQDASVVLYAVWSSKIVTVTFDAGAGACETKTADYRVGKEYGTLPVPHYSGRIFTGWYSDQDKSVMVYENSVVTSTENMTFYAGWSETELVSGDNKYYAVFFADGNEVAKVEYSESDTSIIEPNVPTKTGYDGEWGEYTLQNGGTVVLAVYKPHVYTATFIADSIAVGSVEYTVETKCIPEPPVPEKSGYIGKWKSYSLKVGGTLIEPQYTPITYYVHFIAEGKEISQKSFVIKSTGVSEPSVPNKSGYSGKWTEYSLDMARDVYSYAVYTPENYKGKFTADGRTVFEFTYTVEDTVTDLPDVPEKVGYTGKWDEQIFPVGGTEIKAIYTPNEYTVRFLADGKEIGVVSYTYGAKSIDEPAVPEKKGYAVKWSPYSLGAADSVVEAIYTPINYKITFMVDGVVFRTYQYNVTTGVIEPKIPEKPNTISYWEDYELSGGDITVNAVYVDATYVNLVTKKDIFAIYKNQSILITANYGNLYNGMVLRWYVNGEPVDNDNSETLLVSEVKKSFTVEAKVIDKDGNVVASSSVLKVSVVRSFFRSIVEFFKNLAKKPTIRTP